jgi:hypothetical protein
MSQSSICEPFQAILQNSEKRLQLRHVALSLSLSLCRSLRPPVRMGQLGPYRMDFHEILHFSIFRKYVEKIQVSLKSDKNNGYFT